jgi:hypothetical protein
MRDSTTVKPQGGASRNNTGHTGSRSGQTFDKLEAMANRMTPETSEAQESYYLEGARAAKSEADRNEFELTNAKERSNDDARTAKSGADRNDFELTNAKLRSCDDQIDKLEGSADSDDQDYVVKLKAKRQKLREDLLR